MVSMSTAMSGHLLADLPGGVHPAHAGQRAIHDDHAGLEFAGEFYGVGAVAGLGDDGDFRIVFQHQAKAAADEGVIIDEENRDLTLLHSAQTLLWNFQSHQRTAAGCRQPLDGAV